MTKAGVKVLGITAEPGGESVIKNRLSERGCNLQHLTLRSDPEHKSLQPGDGITSVPDCFTLLECDTNIDISGPYTMIQPALVVYDTTGAPIPSCTWSWKAMGVADGQWNTRVTVPGAAADAKQVLLVTVRPDMTDLLASVQEQRLVKLISTHNEW